MAVLKGRAGGRLRENRRKTAGRLAEPKGRAVDEPVACPMVDGSVVSGASEAVKFRQSMVNRGTLVQFLTLCYALRCCSLSRGSACEGSSDCSKFGLK